MDADLSVSWQVLKSVMKCFGGHLYVYSIESSACINSIEVNNYEAYN